MAMRHIGTRSLSLVPDPVGVSGSVFVSKGAGSLSKNDKVTWDIENPYNWRLISDTPSPEVTKPAKKNARMPKIKRKEVARKTLGLYMSGLLPQHSNDGYYHAVYEVVYEVEKPGSEIIYETKIEDGGGMPLLSGRATGT